ncbi:MAG TPA: cytochrome ubiquinol oxidase subunit I, partial [Oceanospirillaceae bacterium]|nr:cytochrome ubiquinol oxidase subunit I [Oceanospirillaceae bacterium]
METELVTTLSLSRIQFAANISFHILFPTITMALGWLLFYFKLRFEISQHPVWMRIYRFWVKIFALTFAIGVVTGITMSFQFGTNWPGFMEKVGNIAGPLLGYEVMSAFFLEATFLGVMLFGIRRVPSKLHTLATLVVAIGTSLSAFWIIALNSWMHTPTGFIMENGVAMPTDWMAIIFNPSMPYRLAHMMLASFLTASFLIAGISAYRLLKGDKKAAPQLALKQSLGLAAIVIVIQITVGDLHGLNTLKHQPAKIAAMEAVWHTEKAAPLVLFAWPNENTQDNEFEVSIPYGASLLLTHELEGEIQGLASFGDNRPPVKPVFFGFRIMVGMGILMLIVSWFGVWFYWRRKSWPK